MESDNIQVLEMLKVEEREDGDQNSECPDDSNFKNKGTSRAEEKEVGVKDSECPDNTKENDGQNALRKKGVKVSSSPTTSNDSENLHNTKDNGPEKVLNKQDLESGKLDKDTQYDRNITNDQIDNVRHEWNGVENFQVKTFFINAFLVGLSTSDFVLDNMLGIEHMFGETIETDNITTLPPHCQNIKNITTSNNATSFVCQDTSKRIYGIMTIVITFLPGIQWYSSLKTDHRFTKFLTSLFFPIFMVFFKLGHLFHQGPKTAEMNLMVDTCETTAESMCQLVLQVVIIFQSKNVGEVSWLQWLVIGKSLLMAAKGPAEEFLEEITKNEKKANCTGNAYHEIDFLFEKLKLLIPQLPFYLLLTFSRVLTMSLVIFTFKFIAAVVYFVLYLAIITLAWYKALWGFRGN